MEYLNREEFIDHVPEYVGEQVHIHHCKPGKGNDKLYIRRVENGGIAFCHHCGKRGYVGNHFLENGKAQAGRYLAKSANSFTAKPSNANSGVSSGGISEDSNRETKCYYPKDSCNSVKHWTNLDAKIWILKYGIPMDDINAAGICWSDSFSSILFPKYYNGELVAFQARKFPESKPKYMTYGDSKSLYDPLQRACGSPKVVLIEDYISALKVSQIAPAFPLGGTAIKDDQLKYLLNRFTEFDIMLDNDNYQVKRNQIKLLNKISTFTRKARIIEVSKDPKEYSVKELEEFINGY